MPPAARSAVSAAPAAATDAAARSDTGRITREAETELAHRRSELNKEDDRLVKRREELDRRFDQMQQREATLNKRQSSIDRRANEIEGLYTERLAELQRVSSMTVQEAQELLLSEVEKTARADRIVEMRIKTFHLLERRRLKRHVRRFTRLDGCHPQLIAHDLHRGPEVE